MTIFELRAKCRIGSDVLWNDMRVKITRYSAQRVRIQYTETIERIEGPMLVERNVFVRPENISLISE